MNKSTFHSIFVNGTVCRSILVLFQGPKKAHNKLVDRRAERETDQQLGRSTGQFKKM